MTKQQMTKQQWFPIPCHTGYEMTRDGVVRYKGKVVEPEKSMDDTYYRMSCDYSGLQAISPDWLMFLTFDVEPLRVLDDHKDSSFFIRWNLYRWFVQQDVLNKLLSDDFSPRWNEFFADIKEYEDNLDDEGRFHASLHIYGWNNPDGWHRMMEATRACLVLGFATPDDVRKWDWLGEYVQLAGEDFNDPDGGQYDVKDLTMEQAWDFTISFCQRPFETPAEKFWALFCLEDKSSDYPDWRKFAMDTQRYVESQPFEVLEEWVTHLRECGELEDYLEEDQFESLEHYKHFTPAWNDRFKALVPGWEPYVDDTLWVTIPGFSRYEMTNDPVRYKWQTVRTVSHKQLIFSRTVDCDNRDRDNNPTESFNLISDSRIEGYITYHDLLDRTFPPQVA